MNAMLMHVLPLNFSLLSPKTCDLVSAFLRAAKGAARGLSGLFNKVGPLGDDSDRSSVGTPATGA